MDEQKKRLIELLLKTDPISSRDLNDDWGDGEIGDIADYLLANGVIVPPCKVGDTVYAITLNTDTLTYGIHRGYISCIDIRSTGNYIFICHEGLDDEPYFDIICGRFDNFGKNVFFSREEAEAAIATKEKE